MIYTEIDYPISHREYLFHQGRRYRPKEGSREVGAFGIRFVWESSYSPFFPLFWSFIYIYIYIYSLTPVYTRMWVAVCPYLVRREYWATPSIDIKPIFMLSLGKLTIALSISLILCVIFPRKVSISAPTSIQTSFVLPRIFKLPNAKRIVEILNEPLKYTQAICYNTTSGRGEYNLNNSPVWYISHRGEKQRLSERDLLYLWASRVLFPPRDQQITIAFTQ